MSLIDTLAGLLVPSTEPQQMRTIATALELDEQILRLRRRQVRNHAPTITQALSVPAIFRAVTLISNTVGSLSMEAYRRGTKLAEAPMLIRRPNPFSTPREFYRDTAYALASRGEAWWWIASRDADGSPLSLYPVPPHEIIVAQNDANRLLPKITWLTKTMRNEDMVQVVLTREPGALRGAGPLQVCGAAVSVAVEAQDFTANFFSAGGWPSMVIKSALTLDEDEARNLKQQWTETANNEPKVIDPGIESVEAMGSNPSTWQLTEQRAQQNGEAARMFGIPGALLEYNASGSSLTYQNVTEVYTQFVRTCLAPNYLEPVEQAMSDLLDGSTVGRFNTDDLLRADIKTRYEVHSTAIASGVYDAVYAQQVEGIAPGSVDFASVPPSTPQATPDRLPINRSADQVRCSNCNKIHGYLSAPYSFVCHRCKTVNSADAPLLTRAAEPQPAPVVLMPHIEVHNHPPAPGQVTIESGAVQVAAPEAAKPPDVYLSVDAPDNRELVEVMRTLAERPDPVVNVAPAEVTVEPAQVTVEATQVTVNVPEQRPTVKKVKRDKDSNIIEIHEVVA